MRTLLVQRPEHSNRLIMTNKLRQSIELLQYNTIELSDFLAEKSLENPLIEINENMPEYSEQKGSRNPIDVITQTKPSPVSLTDSLIEQLSFTNIEKNIKKAADFIIYSLDSNGYFHENISEAAKILSISTDIIESALSVVQTFEPAGIGARNLQECLLLQLKSKSVANDLEIKIVKDYFELFAAKKINHLSKELNVPASKIQSYIDNILLLDPKPGAKLQNETVQYVIPDITVNTEAGKKVIYLNDSLIPSIHINTTYKSMLQEQNQEAQQYLEEKYKEIEWLNKGLAQRKKTIMAVMEKILEKQHAFFENGPSAIVPLSMKEIADSIGVHESTVSRAVKNKYIQTDFGLFEMKTFFHHSISTNNETDQSSTQIKYLIKDILSKEDKKKPLSDQKIADLLKSKEINVSRRVVTKYREQLNIQNSSKRRRY